MTAAVTKRALRNILKADEACIGSAEPSSQLLADKGYTPNDDYALLAMKEVPYGKWREYDAEDTVRFYALRLHKVGMIKSTPRRSSPRAPTGASSTSSGRS